MDRLIVDLGRELRCLSAAVLGGGLATVRTWANLQVPGDYARTDPAAHLAEATSSLAPPVLGMLTAADVSRFQDVTVGPARAFATVGLGMPLAAAGNLTTQAQAGSGNLTTQPQAGSGNLTTQAQAGSAERAAWAGTINILVLVELALSDAGLAGAFQTAVEAKVQALQEARVRAHNASGFATGTATDVLAVACPPGAEGLNFAGPATALGAAVGQAVYQAVRRGCP